MDGSISLGPAGRKGRMEMYRRHPDPAVRRRAHIVLLLADGRSWLFIESALYCRRRAIDRWKKRFEAGGIEALLGERRGRRSSYGPWLIALVVTWGTTKFPRYFYEPYGATLVADWDGAPWVPGDGPDDLPDSWSPMSPREEPVPIHQIEPVPPEESPGNPSRFGNALMWTGQRLGPPVGLYEFLARPYSPAVGRWQQRDPMGALDLVGQFFYDARTGQITWFPLEIYAGDEYGDMLNLYQYAMLNPVLYLDPTGRNVTTWLASKFLEATGGDQSCIHCCIRSRDCGGGTVFPNADSHGEQRRGSGFAFAVAWAERGTADHKRYQVYYSCADEDDAARTCLRG